MIWGHDPPRTHEKITGKTDSFRAFCFPFFRFARKEEKMNTSIKEETLGQRIRTKRKEAGYSQEKLAELLMIKQNTLSKYENDEHDVPTDILSKLSKILNTTPSYLVWGSTEEEGWLSELRILAGNIKNPVIRETALKQMLALVQMDEAMR